jgi:Fuc2NAc and GlcNAc transferase
MTTFEKISLIFVFIASYFGVELFRRWCLRFEMVDIPNERSSHTIPTPRGGGIIIVILTVFFYLVFGYFSGTTNWYFILGSSLIAFISWLDDLVSINSLWRFLVHGISALLVIFGVGVFSFDVGFLNDSRWILYLLTYLWIVWLTNAYNFMDGIDGIAATQAITAGIGWCIFAFLADVPSILMFSAVLVATNVGFIFHNWSPAKIFMGDVGSAFLGFNFAVLPLLFLERQTNPNVLPFAICAVLIFLLDSVFTFFRRVVNREPFWRAHRSHIYQRLTLRGKSHQYVTLLYGMLSVLAITCYFLAKYLL